MASAEATGTQTPLRTTPHCLLDQHGRTQSDNEGQEKEQLEMTSQLLRHYGRTSEENDDDDDDVQQQLQPSHLLLPPHQLQQQHRQEHRQQQHEHEQHQYQQLEDELLRQQCDNENEEHQQLLLDQQEQQQQEATSASLLTPGRTNVDAVKAEGDISLLQTQTLSCMSEFRYTALYHLIIIRLAANYWIANRTTNSQQPGEVLSYFCRFNMHASEAFKNLSKNAKKRSNFTAIDAAVQQTLTICTYPAALQDKTMYAILPIDMHIQDLSCDEFTDRLETEVEVIELQQLIQTQQEQQTNETEQLYLEEDDDVRNQHGEEIEEPDAIDDATSDDCQYHPDADYDDYQYDDHPDADYEDYQ